MTKSPHKVNSLLLSLLLLLPVLQIEAKGSFSGAMETVYPAWFKERFLDLRADIADATADGRRISARSKQIREQGKDVDIWK